MSHQFRELAIGTERAGMFAKVAHDLQEPLLRRRSEKAPRRGAAEQTLASQAQQRIVLRPRPGEVAPLDLHARALILPFESPRPEPGQNHVDGQI